MLQQEKEIVCPVNSHNEWDPLEEVIVGSVDGAMFPAWGGINKHTFPPGEWDLFVKEVGGSGIPYPVEVVEAAKRDLNEFIHILESEGAKVRRIDNVNYSAPFSTPAWQIPNGFSGANPRDPFIVIGNEIIETPMPDRNRYFETWAYRSLFKEYFKAGARWTAAPKPQLLDALYDPNYTIPAPEEANRFVLTEFEPVFDAADFVRCGRDIFGQLSHVTNHLGVEWLQRHLGDEYRVHLIDSHYRQAIHIDLAFMPLAPGKVLVNPAFINVEKLPPILKKWDILIAPPAVQGEQTYVDAVNFWVNMNVLMLDEERVIVEKHQEPMIKAFKQWGFKPIPCSFENYYPFMGSFHCATLDIRRRGELKSYF
jgi:glycine amidinotransferase